MFVVFQLRLKTALAKEAEILQKLYNRLVR